MEHGFALRIGATSHGVVYVPTQSRYGADTVWWLGSLACVTPISVGYHHLMQAQYVFAAGIFEEKRE